MREALDPSMGCCHRARVFGVARALQVMGDGPGKGKTISDVPMPQYGHFDALRPEKKRGGFNLQVFFHRGVEKKGLKRMLAIAAIVGKFCVL